MEFWEKDPKIMGGVLVLKGTRIPASLILKKLARGRTPDRLHETYPWIESRVFFQAVDELGDYVTLLGDDVL